MLIISLLILLTRLGIRTFKQYKSLWISDYILILAWLNSLVFCVICIVTLQDDLEPQNVDEKQNLVQLKVESLKISKIC
jgi:hypothetical protein